MYLEAGIALGASYLLIKLYATFSTFQHNLNAAKQSGLPYIVVPVFIQDIRWLIAQALILPLLDRLPKAWTESWLSVVVMSRVWHQGYSPFQRVGSDTFIAVSPVGNVVWTCDPDVIMELSTRRADFPKPTRMLAMLNLFGPTITGTEGPESRLYRKITSPSFNEATHKKVWHYSIEQTELVMKRWTNVMSTQKGGISVHEGIARMTLHILSFCAYGRKMKWKDDQGRQGKVSPGHTMSYSEAIASMLDRMPILFFTPPLILNHSPLLVHKQARDSFLESKKYMEELRNEKQVELCGPAKDDPNLLDALVQSSDFPGNTSAPNSGEMISPQAVLGNIFIFILAGHETNANTAVFALTLLACFPKIQRELQEDLDRILASREPRDWTYEEDFPGLLRGYAGAVFNEIVRLFTVLPILPKSTEAEPKVLEVRGKQYIIPGRSLILINTSATHRNPKYWPSEPPQRFDSSGEAAPYPASSFDPRRWLGNIKQAQGSFIPFAEGARACIGQRFAKADFIAFLARLMKTHSVELAVESHGAGQRQAWLNAKNDAEKELSQGVDFFMALKMRKGVPLRIVDRGHEQWPVLC